MNLKGQLTSKLFYIRLLSALTIIMAFIPFCNPFTTHDGVGHGALVNVMGEMSEIMLYFSSEMTGFTPYSNMLFILCLLIYVGLVGLLFGVLLTFSHDKGYRTHGVNTVLYSSFVLFISFVILAFLYLNINLQMYNDHNVAVYRKLLILLRLPLFTFIYGVINFVLIGLTMAERGFSIHELKYKLESYFSHRFSGGVHVPYNKVTRKMPIETIDPPKFMIFPLSQHIGAACDPIVNVGDKVTVGQKIADTDAFVSAPIHSSVSGEVIRIGPEPHHSSSTAPAIVIRNDFEDTKHESLGKGVADYNSLSRDELIDIIREAGITGMGGASFPTHVKIRSALKDNIDVLIVNAAECEPYLSNDNRVILEYSDELIEGLKILCKIFDLKTAYIGIESNKPKAIKKLNKETHKTGIKVVVLHAKYPQGGEKQLIKAVCNREVPSGKLPSTVGCCIFNVDTVCAIYRAVVHGIPVLRRIMTVAGSGVEKPGNYNVRLGTTFADVLEYCGIREETKKLVVGGPMMGIAQYSLLPPVVKSTSGLLCFTEDEVPDDENASCIRCGSCVGACPMHLTPNYIAMYTKLRDFDQCEKLGIADCIECGSCSYICPAKIPLVQYMRLSKQTVIDKRKREAAKK